MFEYKYINGIDVLKKAIPSQLQQWHNFSKIIELNYSINAIDEYYCDYTNKMTLLISDKEEQYKIELSLYNIYGNLNFDMVNGFFSGLTIEESLNSGIKQIFHIYSSEQDIEFDLYCEKIRVILL